MKKIIVLFVLFFAFQGFAQDAAFVQQKLDEGGIWRAGDYVLETAVYGRRPIAIIGGSFKASKEITDTRLAMIYFGYTEKITLQNVTIDGNLAERAGAWFCNGTTDAYRGGNLHFDHVNDVLVDGLITKNAVCGSGMHFSGKRARIINSQFVSNGKPGVRFHWSDGLTLLNCDQCVVAENLFANATDIGLVFGGGRQSLITRNIFRQSVPAFAAFAMDNFADSQSGDFSGTIVSDNLIDCGLNCDFGANLGPHAWYLSANTRGGTFKRNSIHGGKIGILIGGAGTVDAPISVFDNDLVSVLEPGATANFSCGDRVTWPIIVSPDSFALTRREVTVAGFHRTCP